MACVVSRNWLLGGYQATFSHNSSLTNYHIPVLAHALLNEVRTLCSDIPQNHKLRNIKGREGAELLLTGSPAALKDEVFSIGGEIATGCDSNRFSWAPFAFAITSDFSYFEGRSDIVFSLHQSRSDSIPGWLPWWILGAAAPIKINYLRVGLEVFTARFSISRFGSIPVVSDSLLIDVAQSSLAIRLTTQQPRRKRCNPLETNSVFKRISLAIGSALNTPISTQFASDLESTGIFGR